MIPNRHPTTLVPYGVVSLASLADWVFDEFFYNGTDETSAAIEAGALAEHPEWDGELPDGFWDDVDTGEHEYSLVTDDGIRLSLGYLGGAPLVWVLESPHQSLCHPCSPCVPGAGDLDSPADPGTGGMLAYTLPPEWWARD